MLSVSPASASRAIDPRMASGIEVAMIVFAFRGLRAGDGDFEMVTTLGHELVVQRSVRGQFAEARFNLHWVQVVFEPAGIARKSVLALRSHGRTHPIGNLMTEAERSAATPNDPPWTPKTDGQMTSSRHRRLATRTSYRKV